DQADGPCQRDQGGGQGGGQTARGAAFAEPLGQGQKRSQQQGAQRSGAGCRACQQKNAHGRYGGQFQPAQAAQAQQHPGQHQPQHDAAEGVGVAVAEQQPETAVALAGSA